MEAQRRFQETEGITLVVLTDNYYDALRPDPPCGRRFRSSPDGSIHAEHGLSFFIRAKAEGKSYSLIFDYGIDPSGLINNLRILGLDVAELDALVLSHGHYDHWGGLKGLLPLVERHNRRRHIPFVVGRGCFSRRFSMRPGGTRPVELGGLRKEEIEGSGRFKVIESEEPQEVLKGLYTTGLIKMTNEYEKISQTLLVEKEGEIKQDYFEEELALFSVVKDKGLVVVSGCAHRGIVNTVNHIIKLTGIHRIYAIIGGFHLINAPIDTIKRTVEAIKRINPTYVIPAHCTGFEAVEMFKKEMPHQFILNTAGTTYLF